jgi:predicted methyltransferase MtxX (methanogen marker protein 4)
VSKDLIEIMGREEEAEEITNGCEVVVVMALYTTMEVIPEDIIMEEVVCINNVMEEGIEVRSSYC